LLIGTSGTGKSSLINYLAGETRATVSDTGASCTKKIMSYEVTLIDKKLRIFDTQGFNDTEAFTDGNKKVASKIKF
jgi:tRNA U34 5-carboxymethylaminomethyl modifying GTPase MnmE/TrmE